MFSENSSGVMSNDLQPTESGIHGANGQISQIPGLSPSINSLPEEKARGRRVGVLETDSDYVKLAKQGGHKGLLWHDETVTAKANSYKPPDWFYNASGDNVEPRGFYRGTIRIMIQRTPDERVLHSSLINSKEKKSPGAFKPLEAPFGTDNMSAWERDDSSSSSNGKEKNNNVRDSQMGNNVQLPSQYHHTSKFRRIVFDKKPAPVDMSKLLSFGYADDKPVANTDLSN